MRRKSGCGSGALVFGILALFVFGLGDSLALETSLYLRRGQSAITSTADPDTKGDTPLAMKRGAEADFNSLCGRLGGRRA